MSSSSCSDPNAVVATIGVFDGVHLGHRALISKVVERSRELRVESGCVTFRPHPQEVLHPSISIPRLATLEDRIEMIEGLGISRILLMEFTKALANMSPEEFIALLLEHFKLIELWVGDNFAMGRGRTGTPERIAAIGRERGFAVHTLPRKIVGTAPVSSSRIRVLLRNGRVMDAAELLSRYYTLKGLVISGDRRGVSLGFPTANLDVAGGLCVPGDGVYAVRCRIGNDWMYPAVCNIGMRPTFNGVQRRIETHMIGFNGDLYGQEMAIEFIDRIRDERRFESVHGLIEQIADDIKQAEKILEIEKYDCKNPKPSCYN